MKIGILTHPLINNYGGILQAFALSYALKKMGHTPIVLNRDYNRCIIKQIIGDILFGLHIPPYYNRRIEQLKQQEKRESVNIEFIDKYIDRTKKIHSSRALWNEVKTRKLEALIVGSDQVWRADFVKYSNLNYFFDFIPENYNIKRFSYAASFGLDSWDYDENTTFRIRKLLKKFSSISVREYQGQNLCNTYLEMPSKVVLDPTLLLTSKDYDFITSPQIYENYVFVYWLGDRQILSNILKDVDPSLKIIEVSLRDKNNTVNISDWLSCIRYASYVITDSFHGCVFSIIFQKQFKIHVNKSGGFGRLQSLFTLLEIDEKLENPNFEIDYAKLKGRLDFLRDNSKEFIRDNLNK